jgi:hypothetical protein
MFALTLFTSDPADDASVQTRTNRNQDGRSNENGEDAVTGVVEERSDQPRTRHSRRRSAPPFRAAVPLGTWVIVSLRLAR